MIVIGLTGSIGQGKSTVAAQFKRYGAAVCDSDKIVHQLLGHKGEAVEAIARLFPSAHTGEQIDRKLLGKEVFSNAEKLLLLESVLHPLVRRAQERFIRQARMRKTPMVILDIPLLFETQGGARCDYTVVVTAPPFLQRHRVFKRSGMTEEKLARILKRQMPDAEKCKRADFVIRTGTGKYTSLKAVREIVSKLLC